MDGAAPAGGRCVVVPPQARAANANILRIAAGRNLALTAGTGLRAVELCESWPDPAEPRAGPLQSMLRRWEMKGQSARCLIDLVHACAVSAWAAHRRPSGCKPALAAELERNPHRPDSIGPRSDSQPTPVSYASALISRGIADRVEPHHRGPLRQKDGMCDATASDFCGSCIWPGAQVLLRSAGSAGAATHRTGACRATGLGLAVCADTLSVVALYQQLAEF